MATISESGSSRRPDAVLEDLLAAGPRSVALMLTTRCNLRCTYCYQDKIAPRSMPLDVLEAAISLYLRSDCASPTLTFYGGEPLLEMSRVRCAIELVREAAPADLCPDVRIFTNGLLLDADTLRFLVDANVHITLSMDGLPGSQDQRGPGSFEVVDRMLLRYRAEHPGHFRNRFAVSATLTSRNVSYLADSFRYFLARGVREVRVSPVMGTNPRWVPASGEELDRQLADVVEASLEIEGASAEVPFLPLRGVGAKTALQPQGTRMCGAASRMDLFIDVDGSLAPCAAMARSCLRRPPPLLRDALVALGTLRVSDPELDEKLAARERRAQDLPLLTGKADKFSPLGRCRDCPAGRTCFICPASIALGAGVASPDLIPAIDCDFNRITEEHRTAFHRALRARAQDGASRVADAQIT